jgi:hypothetical protein
LGTLLQKVASNKHFQRFAALKPVAGVIEKLSNAEVGAKVELTNFSGMMTVSYMKINSIFYSRIFRLTFHHRQVIVYGNDEKNFIVFSNKSFVLFRIGFPEMPDLSLKVTPVFGESKYSNTLIHDFLEARIRDELKVNFEKNLFKSNSSFFKNLLANGCTSIDGRSIITVLQ